uniref:Cytochrome c oxidase subunit 7A2, mitochondrial-like protein n=1 Tax=Callorhinchus milii TaxID=7868 RepID=V9LHF7_CALMI
MQKLMTLPASVSRRFSTSVGHQLKNNVPELQKIFQADNGLPVHLKGGTLDFVLYRFTMGVTVVGTCLSLYELFKAALPRKTK